MAKYLNDHAKYLGRGFFQGKLYLVDYYPGAIASKRTQDKVVGDIYELYDSEKVFEKMDDYEECGPRFPKPWEYYRKEVTIHDDKGGTLSAWIYLYNKPTQSLKRLPSGDFLWPEISTTS